MINILKAVGVLALIAVGIAFAIGNMGHQRAKVEKALIEEGYQNPQVRQHMLVVCLGNKDRYGYKWKATRNGQTVQGEACSGGLFQDTVIKP